MAHCRPKSCDSPGATTSPYECAAAVRDENDYESHTMDRELDSSQSLPSQSVHSCQYVVPAPTGLGSSRVL